MTPSFVGPYQIERELGRGGMGVVYAGRHRELGRLAAIKLLLQESDTPDAKERFQRECESLGRLDHPGIVKVYDSGFHSGRPFVALEFVDGAPLDETLAKSGPFEPRRAIEIGIEMCEAIEHAHQAGILHRDLKPANVLLDREGKARITDFGLAKDLDARSLTVSGTMLGTPAYMPPEQAAGDRSLLGPASDVYGLGATLFALLTGEAPFSGPTPINIVTQVFTKPAPSPSSVRSDLDSGLDALILRCLEKEPSARFASAAELGTALRGYLQGERLASRSRRGPALVVGFLILLAALGLGAGLYARSGLESKTPAAPTPNAADRARTARDAWHQAKTAEQLRAWLARHGEFAPDRVQRTRVKLAGLTWAGLPTEGTGSDTPVPGDVTRIGRHRAVWSWAREHLATASERVSAAARIELDALKTSGRILAWLPNVNTKKSSQNGSFMLDGSILIYGKGGQSRVYDLAGKSRDLSLFLGPDVDVERVRTDREGVWALAPNALALGSEPNPPRLRLEGHLRARDMAVVGEKLVLVGSRDARLSGGYRGFLGLVSKADLRKGSRQAWKLRELTFAKSAGCLAAHPSGDWVYVGGGSADSDKGNGFVAQVEIRSGQASVVAESSLAAEGKRLAVSADGTQLFVGLNRGGVLVYPIDPRGRVDESRSLLLQPISEGVTSSGPVGGVTVQAQGLAFLSNGDFLLSSDLYEDPLKRGFLTLFKAGSLKIGAGKGREAESNEGGQSAWSAVFPGVQTRHIAISPDRTLLALGGKNGTVLILPAPWWEREDD